MATTLDFVLHVNNERSYRFGVKCVPSPGGYEVEMWLGEGDSEVLVASRVREVTVDLATQHALNLVAIEAGHTVKQGDVLFVRESPFCVRFLVERIDNQ